MTLLDAPKFDAARDRRNQVIFYSAAGAVLILLIAWWLFAGRPVDWPWNWNAHLMGRATINNFLTAVEQNDMAKAYGIWNHDKDWQKHPNQYANYPLQRFELDWAPNAPQNEYGIIKSHRIAAARVYGNVLLAAVLINDRKSDAINLDYDPKTGTLNFSPEGVEINPESYSH